MLALLASDRRASSLYSIGRSIKLTEVIEPRARLRPVTSPWPRTLGIARQRRWQLQSDRCRLRAWSLNRVDYFESAFRIDDPCLSHPPPRCIHICHYLLENCFRGRWCMFWARQFEISHYIVVWRRPVCNQKYMNYNSNTWCSKKNEKIGRCNNNK